MRNGKPQIYSGRIPLPTFVPNTCIMKTVPNTSTMHTDNLENETKENSTNSRDQNNNL